MKDISYVSRQAAWLATYNVKPGDKVRIIKKDKDSGWQNAWPSKMDKFVNDGKEYTVGSRHLSPKEAKHGVYLVIDWWFPYTCLLPCNIKLDTNIIIL